MKINMQDWTNKYYDNILYILLRWNDMVIAILSLVYGIGVIIPGDLSKRSAALVVMVQIFPGWVWSIAFIICSLLLFIKPHYAWKQYSYIFSIMIWGTVTISYILYSDTKTSFGIYLYMFVFFIAIGQYFIQTVDRRMR